MQLCGLSKDGMKGKESKFRERLQDGILMGLSQKRKMKIMKKPKNIGRTRVQRDPFWMNKAVERNYKGRLSGYSKTLLIISIGAAKKFKFVQAQRGGGRLRLQKTERFWAL